MQKENKTKQKSASQTASNLKKLLHSKKNTKNKHKKTTDNMERQCVERQKVFANHVSDISKIYKEFTQLSDNNKIP